MYCTSCGNQLPDGSVQCHYCGEPQPSQQQNNSPYETGEAPVFFNPPPPPPPPPQPPQPSNKSSKGILIGVIAVLCIALLALLFFFVIKPKIDEKKNPNSAEPTASTTSAPVEQITTPSPETDESKTGNEEKTTKRESATKKEKTSKKDESEKTNTNNRVDNSEKEVDDNNAITLPPEIDPNDYQAQVSDAYTTLDTILETIEWGSDAELDKMLKNDCGLVYSNPDDKFLADVLKSTIPYFTYKFTGYKQIGENSYNFYIDIYTVDFFDVADAFSYEVLAYVEDLYWYGDEPTDEEIDQKLDELYLEAFNYYDHDSVITSTYITMTYVNGKWDIDDVADIFIAMLCDYEESWEYADQIISEGIDELDQYYTSDIYYEDDYI